MPRRKTGDKNFIDITKEINLEELKGSIRSDFTDFPDPRQQHKIVYPAWYLILIILCGYLAGCNTISDIAHFAELKTNWFSNFIGRITKAPSYDTIWWFLSRTSPEAFKALIGRWLKGVPKDFRDKILAIDGKRLRGVSDNEHITHIVEMFAIEGRFLIAQEKVPNKRSEKVALPILLDSINVEGAIVTLDALYANVADLQKILTRGADYIVGIKGNQPLLEAKILNFFHQAHAVNFEGVNVSQVETKDEGHGRKEVRNIIVTQELEWLPQKHDWGLEALIEIRSERILKGKTEYSTRYYGASRIGNAEQFSKWIRGHWGIENSLHYVMDVVFQEDASLANAGYSAENMSLLRRLAMNIVRVFDPDRGMADARRCAMYEPNYLRGLLAKVFIK